MGGLRRHPFHGMDRAAITRALRFPPGRNGLSIGEAIRVGDLTLPAGATTDVDPEDTVVAGQGSSTAAEVEEEAEEAGEEAGEGDGGAGEG